MRLIDADNLNFEGQKYNQSQMKAILNFVDAQPTAYNVDEVVAELEEASYQEAVDDMDAFGDIPSMVVSLKTATRIVRNGGKE